MTKKCRILPRSPRPDVDEPTTRRYEIKVSRTAKRVVVLAYEGMELLDVAGPVNVLSAATRLLRGQGGYDVELYAREAGPVRTAGGLELVARRWSPLRGAIDTLLVPGSLVHSSTAAREVVPVVRRLAPRARRLVGVCTGGLLLADAGFLEGRRAVTHWAACDELRRREPSCAVEEASIFVHDDDVWTSAGVTAGMDLALALVEADHDADLALQVARWLVMYLRRPGSQAQFSDVGSSRPDSPSTSGEPSSMDSLVRWIGTHLGEDLSVSSLARRVAMSPRNFARVFARHTGDTPAAWVARARLRAARTLLERTTQSVAEVAEATGQSPETLHRAFQRHLGATPRQYRQRFTAG